MTETPVEIIDRLAEAMRSNDPRAAAAVYGEDVVIKDPIFDVVGRDAAVEAFAAWFSAFRVLELEITERISEGSAIAVRWEWRAIHQGAYLGVPASGREFTSSNVIFFHTRDGYVTRDLSTWDCSEFLRLAAQHEEASG
jgi:steroid delta-isomerase-like uncharacterized protein